MPKIVMPPHGNSKYPWKKFTDGKEHFARQGDDFTSRPESFRQVIRNYARLNGLTVTTTVRGNLVRFRFTKPIAKGGR